MPPCTYSVAKRHYILFEYLTCTSSYHNQDVVEVVVEVEIGRAINVVLFFCFFVSDGDAVRSPVPFFDADKPLLRSLLLLLLRASQLVECIT